jgi:hypothetical protein
MTEVFLLCQAFNCVSSWLWNKVYQEGDTLPLKDEEKLLGNALC